MRPAVLFTPLDELLPPIHQAETADFDISIQPFTDEGGGCGIGDTNCADIDPFEIAARAGKIEFGIRTQPKDRPVVIIPAVFANGGGPDGQVLVFELAGADDLMGMGGQIKDL